jgi:hypothetical protein
MGYNVHDVLKKVIVYITLNNFFLGYDFKLSLFFKVKHKICKKFLHFYKFIFIIIIIIIYWINSNHFS